MIGLYRCGRLTETDLDAQMDEISKEETSLDIQIAELSAKIAGTYTIGATINSAQALLDRLRERLDEPISWELKRSLIEVLVAGVRVDTIEEFGVKQARITVNYRFSQPDQPMPVVLPQSYSTGSVIRIPAQPQSVGDHIRKRRLSLKMLQKDVGDQLAVDKTSVYNWEANTSNPEIRYMPAIIRFLGYNPLPVSNGLSRRLVRQRTSLGLSQKDCAIRIGVDASTLARWERGERQPAGEMLNRVTRFLDDEKAQNSQSRRAG